MSERVRFNRCLNKEPQYYGLKFTGILFAGILGVVLLIKFNFTVAILGSAAGYLVGAGISSLYHKGLIQRWIYWNLPIGLIVRSKTLPSSCDRRFL